MWRSRKESRLVDQRERSSGSLSGFVKKKKKGLLLSLKKDTYRSTSSYDYCRSSSYFHFLVSHTQFFYIVSAAIIIRHSVYVLDCTVLLTAAWRISTSSQSKHRYRPKIIVCNHTAKIAWPCLFYLLSCATQIFS